MSLFTFSNQIKESIIRNSKYSESNLLAIGWVGVIGFPLYYFIWNYLFPQPYESLTLRLIGCALFIPLVFLRYWPDFIKRLLPLYWLLVFIFALPYFFIFMTLMNNASSVWGMSTMAAIFLLFLLIDNWVLINIMFCIGALLGWLTYILFTGTVGVPVAFGEHIPVYLFTLIAGSIFSHKSELLRQERLRIMLSVGGNIAHELRTPLLGIKSGVTGLKSYLPKLVDSYKIAVNNRLDVPKIRKPHFRALETLTDRIESETIFSNSIIDILLMNSGNLNIDKQKFSRQSINGCVATAIERFPFQSPLDREKVHFVEGDDFYYFGSDLLCIHVIFNLIKNAMDSIHEAGKGEITIRTLKSTEGNRLIFTDTGKGIDASLLPQIFKQFFTTAAHGMGAGIGLSFCRHVMESFEGKITAKSEPEKFTEITMVFKEL